MIEPNHKLPIARQAKLLKLSRGTVYYLPKPVSPADLALMRRIDELHLEHPFMGARMLRDQLAREGLYAGRRHIRTLMLRMGIEALAPQPGTSKAAAGNKIYPYLLRQAPHHPHQPGLGLGHDLHSHGQRLCLSHSRRGRGQPPGIDPQGSHHAGGLSRKADHRRGFCPVRHA